MNDNIAKTHSKSIVMPTGKPTDRMALKIFPQVVLLLNSTILKKF